MIETTGSPNPGVLDLKARREHLRATIAPHHGKAIASMTPEEHAALLEAIAVQLGLADVEGMVQHPAT